MPQSSQPDGWPIQQQSADDPPSIIVVASQQGAVAALRAADGALTWQTQMELEVSSVVCDRERVYVATHVDASVEGERPARLIALRASDGSPVWRQAVKGLAGSAGLALDSDRLVATSNMGDAAVYAFETRTGRLRWRYALYRGWDRLLDPMTPWGLAIARIRRRYPSYLFGRLSALGAGIVYIAENEAPYPPHFTALDARTGAVRWRYHQTYSTIRLAEDGQRLVVESSTPLGERRPPTVLVAKNGAKLATPSPLLDGSTVQAMAGSSDGYMLYIMEYHPTVIVARRLEDGAEVWRASAEVGEDEPDVSPNAILLGAQLILQGEFLCYIHYLCARSTHDTLVEFVALNARTGHELWRWRSPTGLDYNYTTVQLRGGGEAAYLATKLGLFALRLSDGQLLWRGGQPMRVQSSPSHESKRHARRATLNLFRYHA